MKIAQLNLEQYDKKAIVQKLKSMGLPTPKTEHLRYFGIRPIIDRDYEYYTPEVSRIEEGENILIEDGKVTAAPKSVYVEIEKSSKFDDSHYDQFYYISHLLSPYVIHIEIDEPGEYKIVQKFTKNGMLVPYRVKISVKPNIRIKITEDILAISDESLYLNGFDIEIGDYAALTLISNRVTNIEDFTNIGSHYVKVAKDAVFNLYTFDFGNAKTLHNYHVLLDERAVSDENHIIFGKEKSKLGNTFHIEHRGKEAKTTQLSRNILKDKARGIFDGLLIVKNSAKHASIYQDSKTILLNCGAFMISKPQMEIYTEYIQEATHGSTTGHIDEEQLFYLRQRGISESEAKEMLVLSFLNEIFEKLGDEEFKEEFVKIFEESR